MLDKLTLLLVILGAVHIGIVTIFGVDLVHLFGPLSTVFNLAVGLSGVYVFLVTYTTLLKKPV